MSDVLVSVFKKVGIAFAKRNYEELKKAVPTALSILRTAKYFSKSVSRWNRASNNGAKVAS